MLPKVMESALNNQIKYELESGYRYLAMSAYCETQEYAGFAGWLRMQAEEELKHAMKFFAFINDRGGRVLLQSLAQPKADFGTMAELFATALDSEVTVTGYIHDLYELAMKERDLASIPLLQWFITEQVEEEKTAKENLALAKRAGKDAAAMLALDRRLSERG